MLIEVAVFIGDVYNKNSTMTSNMRNFMLCNKFAKISEIIQKASHRAYIGVFVLVMLPQIYNFCFYGETIPPMRICFIYLYEKSGLDYALEWAFNCLVAVISGYLVYTYDILITIIIINVLMVSTIITGHLADLNEVLFNPANPANPAKDTKYRLRAIILMILRYNE